MTTAALRRGYRARYRCGRRGCGRPRKPQASARRRRFGRLALGCALSDFPAAGRFLRLGRFLGLRLALLTRDRLLWIAAWLALDDAGRVEEAHDAVRRLRALLHPALHLFEIELEPFGPFLRQQRIEEAEPLDEAAVARRAAVSDDDVIEWPLLGSGAGHANDERHFSFPFKLSVTSFFRGRADRAVRETFRRRGQAGRECLAAISALPAAGLVSWAATGRTACSSQARPSAPVSACRSRSPSPARCRRAGRAWHPPSPSSCRPCRDASSKAC